MHLFHYKVCFAGILFSIFQATGAIPTGAATPVATKVQPVVTQVQPVATQVQQLQPVATRLQSVANQVEPMAPQSQPMATQFHHVPRSISFEPDSIVTQDQQTGFFQAEPTISQCQPINTPVQSLDIQVDPTVTFAQVQPIATIFQSVQF